MFLFCLLIKRQCLRLPWLLLQQLLDLLQQFLQLPLLQLEPFRKSRSLPFVAYSLKLEREIEELRAGIHAVAGHEFNIDSPQQVIPLQLRMSLRNSLYHEQLIRLLVSGCGLTVDHDIDDETSSIELVVSGEASAKDLGAIAKRLIGQSEELLDVDPGWQDGMIGVMQLVVMAQAAQILRERAT